MKLFNYTTIVFTIALNLTLTPFNAFGDTVISKTKEQIKRIHWHTLLESNQWDFTLETILDTGNGKEQHRIQQYRPLKPEAEQWQLLQQDHETPSKAMLAEYAKVQASIRQGEEYAVTDDFDIIDTSTLTAIKGNKDYAMYSFKPRLPMFNDEINQLFKGTLFFNVKKQRIESLSLSASDSFSPATAVKVKQYDMTIEFMNIDGAFHVHRIVTYKTGKMFFFNSFKEKSTRILSKIALAL